MIILIATEDSTIGIIMKGDFHRMGIRLMFKASNNKPLQRALAVPMTFEICITLVEKDKSILKKKIIRINPSDKGNSLLYKLLKEQIKIPKEMEAIIPLRYPLTKGFKVGLLLSCLSTPTFAI